MPSRVHAVVVTRHTSSSHARLLRTIEALTAQAKRPDAITLVVCGDASSARASATVAAAVEGIIQTRSGEPFAKAVALAYPRIPAGSAIWILDQDTLPAPDALRQLAGALERAPLAALAAPKLVTDTDPAAIVSCGVSMTPFGRSVELAVGEIDQGQRDGVDDTLGSDIRGVLIRAELREALRLDPALGTADLGLDLGVRARLAGGRAVLTPRAVVTITGEGPAAVPTAPAARAYATRRAQLHRRLTYAPALAVPLHWLSLLPLAALRSVAGLLGKEPATVLPEWGAAVMAATQLPALSRARGQLRRFRRASWGSVEPLRVGSRERRHGLGETAAPRVAEPLGFFGAGAWAVLAALVVSLVVFLPLLAWPALGGGGLLPLRDTIGALWGDAAWGRRTVGVGLVGPADPFAGVVAILGSLWPGWPSYALVVLWLLALPLAVLGGWYAATRVTARSGLRVLAGILWALAPSFLAALLDGRPAAVIVHLLLPWLLAAALVAHRSWGAAATTSLLLAATLACAPALAPAAALLWVVGVLLAFGAGAWRGGIRRLWIPVPTLAVFAPLAFWQWQQGNLWGLLADPGYVWAGSDAAATPGTILSGFPTADVGRWASLVGEHAGWAALLLAPLALCALAALTTARWRVGAIGVTVAVLGLVTALWAPGIVVSFDQGTGVALWPGNGLSLAWLGVVFAALVALSAGIRITSSRAAAALVIGGAVLACAAPALLAPARGDMLLQNGPVTTLPAFVAADTRGDLSRATLRLTARGEEQLTLRTVWGSSDALGAQSTLVNTATVPVGDDIADLVVLLIAETGEDVTDELVGHGIHYVLLETQDNPGAQALFVQASSALNQHAGLVRVGETDRGTLWRVRAEAVPVGLDAAEQARSRQITAGILTVLGVTLLLSVPTPASLRQARTQSRELGGVEQ